MKDKLGAFCCFSIEKWKIRKRKQMIIIIGGHVRIVSHKYMVYEALYEILVYYFIHGNWMHHQCTVGPVKRQINETWCTLVAACFFAAFSANEEQHCTLCTVYNEQQVFVQISSATRFLQLLCINYIFQCKYSLEYYFHFASFFFKTTFYGVKCSFVL